MGGGDAESGRAPGWPVVLGQSDWNRLPYGHPLNPLSAYHKSLDIIWGQSSERVEGCPMCGKAKDGPDA